VFEQLPPSPAVTALRRELQSQIDRAVARRDIAVVEKLYREIQALARSLGVGRNGQINTVNRVERESTINAVKHNAGPGPSDSASARRGRARRRSAVSGESRASWVPIDD